MKERPILFSAPMVHALLQGRKTVTRRIVKPQPHDTGLANRVGSREYIHVGYPGDQDETDPRARFGAWQTGGWLAWCPYGGPGDRLWVRETWAHYQCVDHVRRPDGRSFSEVSDGLAGYKADGFDGIEDFRSHVKLMSGSACEAVEINGDRWRPSIHMPRWASRITLEITGIRVERLHEISFEDAKAEGVERRVVCDGWREYGLPPDIEAAGTHPLRSARDSFESLWASIHGPGSWDENPWVWVIKFRRVP